ncbi:MAG: glycosyltransferase [Anaerocolumna sp.]|nr:glycosyltransferase [Anaerocolumna sp.]
MKILYICTFYHRAMIFHDLSKGLMNLGNIVTIFNAVPKGSKIEKKYLTIMTNNVIHKECFKKIDRYFYKLKQDKIFKEIGKSIKINEYDIIHSHNLFNGGYAAYKLKKEFNIPYIVTVRNTDINTFLKFPYFKKIANEIVKNAVGIHFLSEPYKNQFITNYVSEELKSQVHKRSIVICNGLEPYWLNNTISSKHRLTPSKIKLLCVGKIDKNKNIETTVKAAEILISKGHEVILTVVGQVKNRKTLEHIENKKFIQIIDYMPKEKLIEIYRENDIYVMPSIHETFGRVYAEAMTQGLPVIYSRGQGFDGIFEDGCVGYSVDSMNADEIAKAILMIINNYDEMSLRCINKSEIFNWDIISKAMNEFYVTTDTGEEV